MPKTAKDPAAVSLGRKGGHARAANLTAKARQAIARKAGQARWAGHVKKNQRNA